MSCASPIILTICFRAHRRNRKKVVSKEAMHYCYMRSLHLPYSTSTLQMQVLLKLSVAIALTFFPCIIPRKGQAQALSDTTQTTVLMVEIEGITPNSAELLTAIQAQLSASQIEIHKTRADNTEYKNISYVETASLLSKNYNAPILFWIQDFPGETTIFFYNTIDAPNHIYRRILKFESTNLSSRFEVVANAVSGLLEESVVTHPKRHAGTSFPSPKGRAFTDPHPTEKPHPKSTSSELSASYRGALFSSDRFSNGIEIGVGFQPGTRLAFNISFTQNLSMNWESDDIRLSVMSRNLSAAIAIRIIMKTVEFRPGILWCTSIRTYTIRASTDTLRIRAPNSEAIHSIVPFISMLWPVHGNIAVLVSMGASISLNETVYQITRIESSEQTMTAPLLVKPTVLLGIMVLL